jgi:CRISPR system Cascade subunit CasA
MSFNLICQPWLRVVTSDFQLTELSLIDFLRTWGTLREIAGDNPPTTLALYRFLVAILHRAYDGPLDEDHWRRIYSDDGDRAIAYLVQHSHLFDLLDPVQPFFQDLALTENLASPVYNFFEFQGEHTATVFSHSHAWTGFNISLAQAARLLIRLQSVDLPSLRAAYPGFPGSRAVSGTPTLNVVNCIVRGSSLRETLLLNLVQYDSSGSVGLPASVSGQDLPTWELGYRGKPRSRSPSGYLGYLTYPWRRLRLFLQGDRVFRLALTRGDFFPDHVLPATWECFVPYDDAGRPVGSMSGLQVGSRGGMKSEDMLAYIIR